MSASKQLRAGEPASGCEVCGERWSQSAGCTPAFPFVDGTTRVRIPVGDERDMVPASAIERGYCGDCGADVGQAHHAGCDLERCPRCGEQGPLYCGCAAVERSQPRPSRA